MRIRTEPTVANDACIARMPPEGSAHVSVTIVHALRRDACVTPARLFEIILLLPSES